MLKFDWVVNIKPVGSGQAVLKYLAPYVYRIAISDNRIVSVADSGVTYKVKPSGESCYQTRFLEGERFVRAFAQHTLPAGFKKIRYYGFLSSNNRLRLADARMLVMLWLGWMFCLSDVLVQPQVPRRKPPQCDRCGADLRLMGITDSSGRWLWRDSEPARGPPITVHATQRLQRGSRVMPILVIRFKQSRSRCRKASRQRRSAQMAERRPQNGQKTASAELATAAVPEKRDTARDILPPIARLPVMTRQKVTGLSGCKTL